MQHPDVRKEYLGDISENFQQRPSVLPHLSRRVDDIEAEHEEQQVPVASTPSVIPAPHGWFRRKERARQNNNVSEATSTANTSKSPASPAILPMHDGQHNGQVDGRRTSDWLTVSGVFFG